MTSDKPLVFISCGQRTPEEKQLGGDICKLLGPDLEPYFAEYQSTVEGLSTHILQALHRAAGYICVMHPRGSVQQPNGKPLTRASVWVEQEVAVITFINQILERSTPVLFYKHSSVGREGIRECLLLNAAVEFEEPAQVLDDLRTRLAETSFKAPSVYELRTRYEWKTRDRNAVYHAYVFSISLENTGREAITDFELIVNFPKGFLSPRTIGYPPIGHERRVIRSEKSKVRCLYPGKRSDTVLEVEYYCNDVLFHSGEAMASSVSIELCSGSMKPFQEQLPIKTMVDY